MTALPFAELDREIARAVSALGEARAGLRVSPDEVAAPLARERRVSTRTTWLELGEAGDDALSRGARAWVQELTLARVTWADEVRIARAWLADGVEHEDLEPKRSSPRFARARLLAELASSRRGLWAQAFSRGAGGVQGAVTILAERRAEAARRLGLADPTELELPCDPGAAIGAAAEELLTRTDAIAVRFERWDEALAGALARSATGGWPARLGKRWLASIFAPTGLLDGLSLDVDRLPEALGAVSFARALAALGAAYAEADVPRSAPFFLARPPFDLRRARRSALFGGLVADPVFCARVLGLGKGEARDQSRTVAAALLTSLRLSAAKVLLRGLMVELPRPRGERFEGLTARALGARIPASLAGVLPSLRPSDATDFAGALLAARDRRELVERTDEDWFRSPHAALVLREEQGALAPSARTTADALGAGLGELMRGLGSILG